MPYNSPRRHLLQAMSLVEDILERRRKEGQQLSDEEYEAMQHLCTMAPRQPHQPPLIGSSPNADKPQHPQHPPALQPINTGVTSSRAAFDNSGGSLPSPSSEGSMTLHRTESTFNSPQARSAVSKLKKALGLGSALVMSELLAKSRDEVSALVNFAMTCSALTSQPVKLIQQLVEHVTKLFQMKMGPAAARRASVVSGDDAAAAAAGSPANPTSNVTVVAMIREQDYLIDPVNQTMVADNGRTARLFPHERKGDTAFEKGALYVAIAAEGEVYGYVQISGLESESDVSEEKKQLTLATAAVAALTLRNSFQLSDLDFAQRKQSLLLRIANSIAGDAFATEAEVLTRLTVKSRDLVEANQCIFFKVDEEGDLHLLSKGELLRLERLENPGGSHMYMVADGPTLPGESMAGLTKTASNVLQLGTLSSMDDEALSDEAQLASHAAEHIAHSGQVMQLQQSEAGSGLVEVPAGSPLGSNRHASAGATDVLRSNRRGGGRGVHLDLPGHIAQSHSVRSVLGVPVLNDENKVIGVMIFCNKGPKRSYGRMEIPQLFEQRDTDILLQLSSLASIALANSRSSLKLKSEKRRREAVLNVVAHLNEADITNVDEICKYVMHAGRRLLNADRSTLFLIDEEYDELYSAVADSVGKVIRFPVGKGIAGRVALTGNAEVISDAYKDDRFNQAVDKETGYRTLSILTLPVYTKGNVVAVAQLINKLDNRNHPIAFTSEDQETLRTFVMFAGIAIGNSKLLEFTVKAGQEAMALTTNFDGTQHGGDQAGPLGRSTTMSNMSLAQHVRPIPQEDIVRVEQAMETLKKLRDEDREKGGGTHRFDPTSTQFDLFALRDEAPDGAAARDYASAIVVELFEAAGFDRVFKVERETIICFVLQCRKMYRFVPYHNFFHAVDATQTIYTFMFSGGGRNFITESECFVMLVTALVHDLDHMGTNNSYHMKTDSPLGILSAVSGNNSVLEVHHCNVAIQILGGSDCNIFGGMDKSESPDAYRKMMNCVLATDMARHGELLKQFENICEEGYDKKNESHRVLAMQMLMKGADISNVTKPFEISRQWAVAVTEEFYQQGDRERAKGLQVVAMNDRSLGTELAKGQLGFINFVAQKFFTTMQSGVFKGMSWATDQLASNKAKWQETVDNAGH